MTRHVENAVILTSRDAALLVKAARLDELRIMARGKSETLYQLLHDIHLTALAYRCSVDGTQSEESGESGEADSGQLVTTTQLANRTGVSPRTVRNHIAGGLLRATLHNRSYVVPAEDANQYIAGKYPA